jgi:hypothetical protein
MDRLKLLAAGLAMLTVAALPALAQSVVGEAPETSPTPVPVEICEAVVEGGEIVEGIEYGSEVIECDSITEDIITPASILPPLPIHTTLLQRWSIEPEPS